MIRKVPRPRVCTCGMVGCRKHGGRRSVGPSPYGADWQALVRKFIKPDTRCARCGGLARPNDPMTLDHIVPLSMGGTHDPANLQPMHRSENISKGGRNRRR